MAQDESYVVNDDVECFGQFFDRNDQLVDPADVTGQYKSPSGDISNAAVTLVGTEYIFIVPATAPGVWWYKMRCTNPASATEEKFFRVRASEFN